MSQVLSLPLTTFFLPFFYIYYEQQKNYITVFWNSTQLGFYLLKVNDKKTKTTRARYEMCLKIIVRTPERRQ